MEMVAKAGSVVCIHLRPHDLRRHAAIYASRAGIPIEIFPKLLDGIRIFERPNDIL